MNLQDFVRHNWKFILLVTVALSIAAVLLVTLRPQQYERQITMDIKPISLGLSEDTDQPIVSPEGAANQAVRFLRDVDLEGVSIISGYNLATQQVDITLQSKDREELEGIGPRLVNILEDRFRKTYEGALVESLKVQLADLSIEAQAKRETLDRLEREIESVSGEEATGLQMTRAQTLSNLVTLKAQMREVERIKNNPNELIAEPIVVSLVSESQIIQSRSFAPMVALAVMLSFIMAVIAAIIRTTVRYTK